MTDVTKVSNTTHTEIFFLDLTFVFTGSITFVSRYRSTYEIPTINRERPRRFSVVHAYWQADDAIGGSSCLLSAGSSRIPVERNNVGLPLLPIEEIGLTA